MEELLQKYVEEITVSSDECDDNPSDELSENIENEVGKLEEVMSSKGIEGIKQTLYDNAEKWKAIPINIAVTGCSGAGKSSFINSFLGLGCDDEGAAEVGETETTKELKSYFNQKRPNFKLWDMPGVGTPSYPMEDYLEKVKFDRYDFFLILSQKRFTSTDLWLAVEIQKRNKRFYFIRTCIDNDINSNRRQRPKTHDPELVKTVVWDDIKMNLQEANVVIRDPKIFLVDNLDTKTHDFQNIDRQLLSDCDDLKKEAMVLSLSNMTSKVLEKKKQVLKERILYKAMAIACEFDDRLKMEMMFDDEIKFHAEQFGIDILTVNKNKETLKISKENIQKCEKFIETAKFDSNNKIPRIRGLLRLMLIVKKFMGINHSVRVLCFCNLAFEQNIDEMFKMALEVYGFEAQREVLKSSVFKII